MFFFFFFFEDFEEFLQKCLYSDETFERDKVFGSVMVDYYLPKGSRRLNYPDKTVIEVKERLSSGSTRNAQTTAYELERDFGINSYVLMSHNISEEAIPRRSSADQSDVFKLVDFEELKSSIEKYGTIPFEKDNQWKKHRKERLSRAAFAFNSGRNTFFLGAGVSRDAGLSNWEILLDEMVSDLRNKKEVSLNDLDAINNDCGKDNLVKARYLKRLCVERDISFIDLIRKALYSPEVKDSKLVGAISDCVISGKMESVITYNYDDVLERHLEKKGVPFASIDSQNRPASGQFPILHVHGLIHSEQDKSYDKNVVLSEDEYHALYNNAFHWANIEQVHSLVQTTCFFIGLSMKDPSLRRLLDIAQQRGSGDPVHYAFLLRGEYKQPQKAERILYEMGVNVIWYEDYKELPGMVSFLCSSHPKTQ